MPEGGVLKLSHLYMFFLDNVRTAHLQRHLSAKYIQQSKCLYEYQYTTQPTTKLPKIVSLGFPIFL